MSTVLVETRFDGVDVGVGGVDGDDGDGVYGDIGDGWAATTV